jgi:D-psicose/D-tagatose/L-ribulose 3-epimerase
MEPFVLQGGPVGLDVKIFRNLVPDTSPEGLDKAIAEGLKFARSVFG